MDRRYIVWVDANGLTRLTFVNSVAGSSGVQTQLLAFSQADVLNSLDTALTVNAAPAPPGGQYRAVRDSAALVFQDGAGELVRVQLPAPSASIFMADQVTVDPAVVAPLIAAIIGTVATASGSTVTAYVGGYRAPTTREAY